jgi:hypothetical protein
MTPQERRGKKRCNYCVKIKSSLTILCKKFGLEHRLPKSTSIPQKKRKCIQKKLKYVNLFSKGIKLIVTSDHDHHLYWGPSASSLPTSFPVILPIGIDGGVSERTSKTEHKKPQKMQARV